MPVIDPIKAKKSAEEAVQYHLNRAKEHSYLPCADFIVTEVLDRYATALIPDEDGWFDIASLPEGRHVLLFFEKGQRGNGGIETATVYFNDGDWSYWTHGGPNSGSDFEVTDDGEKPTKWKPLHWPKDSDGGE